MNYHDLEQENTRILTFFKEKSNSMVE